ncbi:hypothetical protein [Chryseolinea sp. H1M3-3]|uniref:hypothetical protein n=1 Tax=Chryseolinea sp. H1M3-3 TaxID=3034144 RepID=UPI0023EE0CC6|nr:hypothetical protein [Chryseolinea sp. H1M3-3]
MKTLFKLNREDKKYMQRTANSTYKKVAGRWLNEALYFVSSSLLADSSDGYLNVLRIANFF